jgi:hypothetical protein
VKGHQLRGMCAVDFVAERVEKVLHVELES